MFEKQEDHRRGVGEHDGSGERILPIGPKRRGHYHGDCEHVPGDAEVLHNEGITRTFLQPKKIKNGTPNFVRSM